MTMTNNLMMRWLTRFFAGSILLATMLLVSCGDDPEPTNEEELITTLLVTLTPNDGGDDVTLKFYDADGDGPIAPVYTYNPNIAGPNSAAVLQLNKSYSASIVLLNETENPVEDVTEEIEEEADEHLFCFSTTLTGLAIVPADTEANYIAGGSTKPVGLLTTWSVGSAIGTGTVTIILRHQPGTKTGTCPGSGETDIEVTFNVTIQ
jgi:hypothetical protein